MKVKSMPTPKVRQKKLIILHISILVSLLLIGCIQKPIPKIDAVQVNFTHYIAGKDHYLKVNSVQKVRIPADSVKPTYYPAFPSIQAYAVYLSKRGMEASPTSYIDINKEGNLTLYVAFEPDKMPLNNSSVMIVVEIRDGKGKLLATDKGVVKW